MPTSEEAQEWLDQMFGDGGSLAHHGVLGQKWGVTRDRAAAGDKRAAKQLHTADKKWITEINSPKGKVAVHNAVADKMNNGLIEKFNKEHYNENIDSDYSTPAGKKYLNEYTKLYNKTFSETVHEMHGESPSGKYHVVMKKDAQLGVYAVIEPTSLAHADDISDVITPMILDGSEIVEAGKPFDNTLAHHGILGMKWGHHKAEDAPASSISSHHVDKEAQKDAREHAKLNFQATKEVQNKQVSRELAAKNRAIEARMSANPEYAKAFNYHSPNEQARVTRNNKVATGVIVGGIALYAGTKLGKAFKPELMHLAYSAGSKIATRRGAGAAATILKEIGPARTAAMVKGADGIFRLATAVA